MTWGFIINNYSSRISPFITLHQGSLEKLQSFFWGLLKDLIDSLVISLATKNIFHSTTFKVKETPRTFQGLAQKFKDF